jgi:hypothetical protein
MSGAKPRSGRHLLGSAGVQQLVVLLGVHNVWVVEGQLPAAGGRKGSNMEQVEYDSSDVCFRSHRQTQHHGRSPLNRALHAVQSNR